MAPNIKELGVCRGFLWIVALYFLVMFFFVSIGINVFYHVYFPFVFVCFIL